MRVNPRLLIAGLVLILSAGAGHAASTPTILWQSNGNADWFSAGNWNLARIPISTDIVDISASGANSPGLQSQSTVTVAGIILGSAVNGRNIDIPNTKMLTVTSEFTLQRGDITSVVAGGTLTLGTGCTFTSTPQGVTNNNISANVANSGTFTSTSGTITIAATGGYTQSAGKTLMNGGTIIANNTSGLQINGGQLGGTGTLTGNVSTNTTGELAPGMSAGSMTISGTYNQSATGVMSLEVGGTAAASNDSITINGASTLGGSLKITLINGFAPADEDTFTVGDFVGGRNGDFGAVTGGSGLGRAFQGSKLVLAKPASITSGLTASGLVGTPFSYTLTGRGKSPITLSLTGLPPGLTATGAVISGTPTTAGTFAVTMAAANSWGTDNQTLVITIGATGTTGSANDSDNDGFSNELETALGTNPNSAASTPFGGKPAGTKQLFNVSKMSIKLNFVAGTTKDQINLQGTLPVPAGFAVSGQTVVLDVGGVIKSFTLDDKGASPRAQNDTFKMSIKGKAGAVEAQEAKFIAKFNKGSFASTLADEQLISTDVKDGTRTIVVQALFNQTFYTVAKDQLYTAKTGKTGRTK